MRPERGPDARIGEELLVVGEPDPSCRSRFEPVRSWKLTTSDQRNGNSPIKQHDRRRPGATKSQPGAAPAGPEGPAGRLAVMYVSLRSLAIGRGLRRPDLIGLALLVDADCLGDLVPFGGHGIERRLGILAADRRSSPRAPSHPGT